MPEQYNNVAESYPIYDTLIVCKNMYGKEASVNGWFTTFRAFNQNERHTFFKSRTVGNSHLAYTNLDSADNIDFVYKCFSIGVRFFAPMSADTYNEIIVSPVNMNENVPAWWLFDLPKHCGFDFIIQQDTIVENTAIATSPGYGPRFGAGAQPVPDSVSAANQIAWKATIGTQGEAVIDNRFHFPEPLAIPRNATIEANIYPSLYARYIMDDLWGPESWVILTENGDAPPAQTDYISIPNRYGIQVSLYGYREVQQRAQYHAPGAV